MKTHRRKLAWVPALALVLATAAAAAPVAWDAKEVLALATELDQAIATVLKMAPDATPQETAFQQRTRDAAVVQMKRAREASQNLVQKLELGWDREETESHFRVLSAALREVRRTAQDAEPQPKTQPFMDRIEKLRFELAKRYEQP